MSKAVLISIHPEWCEKIASGQKTIEVRKTYPKIDTPFKCYIYQTKHKWICSLLRALGQDNLANCLESAFGMVIGEFICDEIYRYTAAFCRGEAREKGMTITDTEMEKQSCLTQDELYRYENSNNNHRWGLLGWHISDLVIYDKSKELREFSKYWDYFIDNQTPRPPQSWCYVEELP